MLKVHFPRNMGEKKKRQNPLTFEDFCNESSIHGVQYLAPSRGCECRVLWSILLTIAVILATLVIHSMMQSWISNPITITTSRTDLPIAKVPFPAITVCPSSSNPLAFIQNAYNLQSLDEKNSKHLELLVSFWNYLETTISKNIAKQFQEPVAYHAAIKAKKEFETSCQSSVGAKNFTSALKCFNTYLAILMADSADIGPIKLYKIFKAVLQDVFLERITNANASSEMLSLRALSLLRDKAADFNITCTVCDITDTDGNIDGSIVDLNLINATSVVSENDFIMELAAGPLSYLTILAQMWSYRKMLDIALDSRKEDFPLGTMMVSYMARFETRPIMSGLPKIQPTPLQILSTSLSVHDTLSLTAAEDMDLAFKCPGTDNRTGCHQSDLQAILTIMKESIRAHVQDGQAEKLKDRQQMMLALNESTTGSSLEDQVLPLIPFCQIDDQWSSGANNDDKQGHPLCTLFRPSFTDMGICHSLNGWSPSTLMKPSDYLETFSSVFQSQEETTPINGEVERGALLVLDVSAANGRYNIIPRQDTSYTLSIQEGHHLPMPLNEGLNLESGFKHKILVTPEVVESADSIRSVPKDTRGCLFSDEANPSQSTFFKNYGHKSCLYECMYNYARQKCRCIPWNYPQSIDGSEVCDTYGNVCFREAMGHGAHLKQCHCTGDCNKVIYRISVNSEILETKDCLKDQMKTLATYLDDSTLDKVNMKKYWDLISENHVKDEVTELFGPVVEADPYPQFGCVNRLAKDIAIIDIRFNTQFANALTRDTSATIFDMFAYIGGTLGLFGGVSLLSMVEIIVYIIRIVIKQK